MTRAVVALGGNALLRRGQPADVRSQRANVAVAADALAELVEAGHQLVVTHGNGPQVGLLALQAAAYRDVEAYPLDVLGAESEGMIGYLLEEALANRLPDDDIATLLTQVVVDPGDPAFAHPSKPIGPCYPASEAARLAAEMGWTMAPDGDAVRRVVASPEPQRIVELSTIRLLLANSIVVICTGGGGIPVVESEQGRRGVEAVIDKDLASAALAADVGADVLLLLTDVDGVYDGWGTPQATRLDHVTATELRARSFTGGSMGPKVEAACRFAESDPRRRAMIGRLADAVALLHGDAGTVVAGG